MAANAEVVERLYEAFERRDTQALAALVDPQEFVFWAPGTAEVAGRDGPYRGRDGLGEYLADVARLWQDLRAEAQELRETGDLVVVTGRLYAWRVGRVIDAPAGWVWRLRDGLVVEGRVFESQREALVATGLVDPGG